MEHTINSRILRKKVTFSTPGGGGGGYMYVNLNGKEGTLGNQMCAGGKLTGSTLTFSGHGGQEKFNKLCRLWLNQYIKEYKYLLGGV